MSRLWLLVVCLLLILAFPVITIKAPSSSVFAINASKPSDNSFWQETAYTTALNNTGATWIRVNLASSASSTVHSYVQVLKTNGFHILGIFDWRICSDNVIDSLSDWDASVQNALVNFGTLVDAVECMNEPDLPNEKSYYSYMDGTPERYFSTLEVLYDRVKNYDSRIFVVGGAVASILSSSHSQGDYYGGYFLEQIRLLGSDSYVDAYSIHVYNTNGYFIQLAGCGNDAGAYYDKAKIIFAGSNKPVWVTEMGHGVSYEESASDLDLWFGQLIDHQCPFITWYLFYGQGYYDMITSNYAPLQSYSKFQFYAVGSNPNRTPPPTGILLIALVSFGVVYFTVNHKKRRK